MLSGVAALMMVSREIKAAGVDPAAEEEKKYPTRGRSAKTRSGVDSETGTSYRSQNLLKGTRRCRHVDCTNLAQGNTHTCAIHAPVH
eukprot:547501-Pyramimonas_sp.AAC.1